MYYILTNYANIDFEEISRVFGMVNYQFSIGLDNDFVISIDLDNDFAANRWLISHFVCINNFQILAVCINNLQTIECGVLESVVSIPHFRGHHILWFLSYRVTTLSRFLWQMSNIFSWPHDHNDTRK